MPHYEKGAVRIRYEEAGAGFPLLVMPGGGLNSRVSNWQTAVYKVASPAESTAGKQRWRRNGSTARISSLNT